MSHSTPASRSTAKTATATRPATVVSHPLLHLLAGIIVGAGAWVFISDRFPVFLTSMQLSEREGGAADSPNPTPGRGNRPRGERGPGGPPGGRSRGAPAGDTAALPATDSESSPAAEDRSPSRASATEPVTAEPSDNSSESDESPATESASDASDCQPPGDVDAPSEPAGDDDRVASPEDASLPVREDQPAANDAEGAGPVDAASETADALDDEVEEDSEIEAGEQSREERERAAEEERVEFYMRVMRERGGVFGLGASMAGTPALTPEQLEEMRVVRVKNSAAAIGLFGMLLCGLFGLVEGIWRRSLVAPLVGALVGVFLGAVGGGFGGIAGQLIYEVHFDDVARDYLAAHPDVEEVRPILEGMLLYGTMWAIVGVAAGLAISLPSRRPRTMCRSVLGAVIGGLLGGMMYATIEAVAFPLETEGLVVPRGEQSSLLWGMVLPAGVNGLLWGMIPAGLIGMLGCWQGRVLPKTKAALKVRTAPAG